ncbi:hypothetical protein PNEG_02687 [Pneumocystis murina B123]|uniref:Proteasome subunit alpha type n=1 Tax=Pneumocystis murina (strain B123) TaxID=1069680 RepID=M7P4Y5_PNEMU|nr:hypothetical protein PNEG_02687 [Pneumocystis murina B123]EMR08905.1 hypothetical protein PNEG_02687 [Pneumocystis murina B123]
MVDRYSFSLTTFSPNGKLVQIEYALAAVNQGVTSIGIKAKNGVVLVTEKKSQSSLVEQDTIDKVSCITPSIGMVYSGIGPDFRVLVDKARKLAHSAYKLIYREYPPTRILVQDLAKVMQDATQSGGIRPFGVSILVAGWDKHNGPSLYQIDPSGTYFPWKATAIGKSAISAKTFLEKRYNDQLELEDAIHIALLTLKEGFEGELSEDTIEIGAVGPSVTYNLGTEDTNEPLCPQFRKLTKIEILDYLEQIS